MTNYTYNQVTEFKVKEKLFSLSGDSFKIQNCTTGAVAFQVSGKLLSIRDSKKLIDTDGISLYKMTEKIMSLRDRMYIEDLRTGEKVFTIRRKHFVSMFKGTIQVWRGGDDDGEPAYEITGSILRKNFKIVDKQNGQEAAVISKKLLSLTNLLTEGDVYIVKVNPGYDTSLMVFLAIAVDEQYHDDD